jgi:hypothetical protein
MLSLVYWSLYKIVKDYSWSNYNKTEGFLLALANNKAIFKALYNLYLALRFKLSAVMVIKEANA